LAISWPAELVAVRAMVRSQMHGMLRFYALGSWTQEARG
jgi:hypothetical protein